MAFYEIIDLRDGVPNNKPTPSVNLIDVPISPMDRAIWISSAIYVIFIAKTNHTPFGI